MAKVATVKKSHETYQSNDTSPKFTNPGAVLNDVLSAQGIFLLAAIIVSTVKYF
jgi:hypothetical protein